MDYTTKFDGQFDLDRPLTPEHRSYLQAFSEIRHMTWNAELLEQMEDDPIRKAVGLPIGEEGLYFTGSVAIDGSTLEHPALTGRTTNMQLWCWNVPPSVAPTLYCQWKPNSEGTTILWDGNEKFYDYYIDWLHFLLEHFLIPWGYVLNGQIHWQSEQEEDEDIIVVANNEVTTRRC